MDWICFSDMRDTVFKTRVPGSDFPAHPNLERRLYKVKLTPRDTAKAQCQQCLGLDQFNRKEIQDCKGDTCQAGPCPLFPYRLRKRTPVKAFRAFCLQCMGGSVNLVRECETETCHIHSYRMGRNPAMVGKRTLPVKLREYNRSRAVVSIQRQESTIRARREESAMETGKGL